MCLHACELFAEDHNMLFTEDHDVLFACKKSCFDLVLQLQSFWQHLTPITYIRMAFGIG